MTDMDFDWLAVDSKGNSPLHHAAERGDVAACAEIISKSGGRFPVDARNNSGLSPLHMAACHGQVETARWLLDHGADLNAVTAGDYEYLWSGATDGYGMQRTIPARSTAMSIAFRHHQQTKWVLGKPRQLVELLEERGAKRPVSSSRRLARFALALPFMLLTMVLAFWGLLHLDGSMTGWKTLAEKYPAASPLPASLSSSIDTHQDGGVGTIGVVRLKGLLRAAATDDGLYLAFPGSLAAGHAPLLIPWSSLRITNEQRLLGVYVLTLEATVGADASKPDQSERLTLRDGIAAQVKARLSAP